jgi:uncharacterized membrane protein SpoIIM required for sporulation
MQGSIDDENTLKRLEEMLDKIERNGLRSLSGDEVLSFGQYYRRAVSFLSEARSLGADEKRIQYLNQLVSRAYVHVYVAESKGWPSVINFFKKEFPQSFRRNLLFILVSLTIFLAPAVFSYGVVRHDPAKAEVILGPNAPEMIDEIASRYEGHKNWMPEEARPMMSSFIITNNIKVAILAFSAGVIWTIGTFLVLFYNGLMLGVIGAAVAGRGPHIALGFWGFVAPHGVIELTAIIISGGAGLMLGWALLNPGEYSRRDALKVAGRESLKLVLGVAAMLVVAGTIEAFFSPSMVSPQIKLSVAAVIGLIEFSYLFLAGREAEKPAEKKHVAL